MADNHLYKYRSFNENTLAIFINYEIYFSKPKSFNDPFDGQFNLFKGLQSFVDNSKEFDSIENVNSIKKTCGESNTEIANSGILSLSEENEEILMWSHYADHHKGICIGFDREGLIKDFSTTRYPTDYDVIYESSKPFEIIFKRYKNSNYKHFAFLDADIHQILTQFKHKNWKYEKEIRFLKKSPGAYGFTSSNMKSVFYGIRTPSRHKKIVNNLIRKNKDFKHIAQYQMKRMPGEFSLYPELLNKNDLEIDGDGED